MTTLFQTPKIPKQAPTPAPSADDARQRVDDQLAARKRRGRASTNVVEQETGVSTAAKVLTGN